MTTDDGTKSKRTRRAEPITRRADETAGPRGHGDLTALRHRRRHRTRTAAVQNKLYGLRARTLTRATSIGAERRYDSRTVGHASRPAAQRFG